MSGSRKRWLVWGLVVFAALAVLNPGYTSLSISGPTGEIKTERFTFGPNSLFVYTRVTADESSVRIEQP